MSEFRPLLIPSVSVTDNDIGHEADHRLLPPGCNRPPDGGRLISGRQARWFQRDHGWCVSGPEEWVDADFRGHAECARYIKSFDLPVMMLGGGGYTT
jgi:hypothetical protein